MCVSDVIASLGHSLPLCMYTLVCCIGVWLNVFVYVCVGINRMCGFDMMLVMSSDSIYNNIIILSYWCGPNKQTLVCLKTGV